MPTPTPDQPIETDDPGFIPIALTSNTDPITGNCTVGFTATLPDGQEPDLSVTAFQQFGSSKALLDLPSAPVTTWASGVGTFEIDMDAALFSQLTSNQATVSIHVEGTDPDSKGDCFLSINLP